MKIKLATENDLTYFFIYLSVHLSNNGSDETGLFLPMSKTEFDLDETMKCRFSNGIVAQIEEAN